MFILLYDCHISIVICTAAVKAVFMRKLQPVEKLGSSLYETKYMNNHFLRVKGTSRTLPDLQEINKLLSYKRKCKHTILYVVIYFNLYIKFCLSHRTKTNNN